MLYDGRGGGIRTPDPLLPKQMRYQAALRPDVYFRLYREWDCDRTLLGCAASAQWLKSQTSNHTTSTTGMAKTSASAAASSEQKRPVAPGVAARLAQVAVQQPVVAAVGLPGDVEDVAEEGNGADQHADAEIGGHAHQRHVGNAANPGGQRNDQREQAGQHVAQAGNQPDDAVEAEADAGAGDAKGLVEQDLKPMQGLVAEEPGAAIPAVRVRRRPPGSSAGLPGSSIRSDRVMGGFLRCAGLAAAATLIRCYNR